MARPLKTGLDYFPLDTDIDQDDKIELIEAEFGLKGFAVIIKLFSKIYRENGYYYDWQDKERLLFAKRLGEKPGGLVDEIVMRSVKWGIFNESLFNQFQILTSSAIQRRYLDATNRRERVEIIKDYLLVDVSEYRNIVNVDSNSINANRGTQRKVKESKEEESKEKHSTRARVRVENHSIKNPPFQAPTLEEVIQTGQLRDIPQQESQAFFYKYDATGWCMSTKHGMIPLQNWQSKLIHEHQQGWLEPINNSRKTNNGTSTKLSTAAEYRIRQEQVNASFPEG